MVSRMGKCVAAVALTCLGAGTVASAAVDLNIDVNTVAVQAKDIHGVNTPVTANFTGSLQFSGTPSSLLNSVQYDGGPNLVTAHVPELISGSLTFVNGLLSGGSIQITFQNAPSPDNTLTITPLPGSGDLSSLPFLTADIASGTFASGNPVGGAAVAPWMSVGDGAIVVQPLYFNASGFSLANMDLTLSLVPEPAGLGVLGVAGASLIARRHRRRD